MAKKRKIKVKSNVKFMASHATQEQFTRFNKDAIFLKAQRSKFQILVRAYEHGEFPESFLKELARSKMFLEEPIKFVQVTTEFNPEAPIQLTSVLPFPQPLGPVQWHRMPMTQSMFEIFMNNMSDYGGLKVFTEKAEEDTEIEATLKEWGQA